MGAPRMCTRCARQVVCSRDLDRKYCMECAKHPRVCACGDVVDQAAPAWETTCLKCRPVELDLRSVLLHDPSYEWDYRATLHPVNTITKFFTR